MQETSDCKYTKAYLYLFLFVYISLWFSPKAYSEIYLNIFYIFFIHLLLGLDKVILFLELIFYRDFKQHTIGN